MQVLTAQFLSLTAWGRGQDFPCAPRGNAVRSQRSQRVRLPAAPLLPFSAPSCGSPEPMVGPGAAQRCPPGWALVLRRAQSCLLAARSWRTASSWLSSHWASARTDWLCRTAGRGWGRAQGGQFSPPQFPFSPPCPVPRTTQVDGQCGQDQARQCQECQQGQQQGVARAEAGAGAGWGYRAQGGQERRGHGGHGPRWGPVQAAGGSWAIACRQGRERVRAWSQAQPGLAQPPLQCSHPLCPCARPRPSTSR